MALPGNFIESLAFIHPREILDLIQQKKWPKGGMTLEIVNEVRPADIFCYFGARFGPPNGIQNILRSDHSDNLIHWDWTLRHDAGIVSVLGMNFRTELFIYGPLKHAADDKEQLVAQLKADLPNHGSEMSKVRHLLESWKEFVNPYQRIRRSIKKLTEELDALDLRPEEERIDSHWTSDDVNDIKARWENVGTRYSKGFGLCFGIRSMLPVAAEAFVNLLLYVLLKPEIREDQRLRENVIRQPIDVRIRSLSINCVGFSKQPDYASEPCRKYHTLVNERNDLLHGNVVVEKLQFNEVYFWGKVPVFREYHSMWDRSLAVEMNAVGLAILRDEIATVDALIEYLKSCLHEKVRDEIAMIAESYELGLNDKTKRIGLLFPAWLADMRLGPPILADEADNESAQ
jgi:hypothetical protein